MGFHTVQSKNFVDQPLQGATADVTRFKKRAVAGQQFFDTEELALYIAETTAGASDSTLAKYGLSPPANITEVGSLFFNGSNHYCTSAFDPSTIGTGDLSVEIWFNSYDNLGTPYLFLLGDLTGDALGMYRNAGNQLDVVYRKSGSGGQVATSTLPSVQRWHQVIMTRTGTTIKVYLDGTEILDSTNAGFDADLDAACLIGASATTPSNTRHGSLDFFRVWNTVLDVAAIGVLFGVDKPKEVNTDAKNYSFSANLLLDNRFEELTGTTVADETGNGNTLTLVNAPIWHIASPNMVVPAYAATKALDLDGATDYLLPFMDLESDIGTGDITLYVRASWDSLSGVAECPFASGNGTANYISFFKNSGNNRVAQMKGDSGADQAISGGAPSTSTFYDLVVTRSYDDATNGTMEFFIDGVSQGTITATNLNDLIKSIAYVGRWTNGGLYHNGKVRCVGIWDEILTDNEITAITTLGDHDFRTDSGNYASQANLLHFLVPLSQTGIMTDLKGAGHAIYHSSPTEVSYP